MKYTVKQLHDGAISKITTSGGIYIVRMPYKYRFQILERSEGRQKTSKGKESQYPLSKLERKIAVVYGNADKYNSDILYIGQSKHGVGIQKRLIQYIGFRYDENTSPHDGGRAIWQLKENEDFIVEIKPCKENETPRVIEKQLLFDFKKKYGNYPFANWKL